ncbi:MAG: ribosome small subunit-dependent GTPase A [Clostridia bacterium]|nr:ribosome small subunit-dependent GTPase A [Clostridia bacterium]
MINKSIINEYGFDEFFENQVQDNKNGLMIGRIIETHKDRYTVISNNGEMSAKLKGSFLYHVKSSDELPTIGDYVWLKSVENGDAVLYSVFNRKSAFKRPDYMGHKENHAKSIQTQLVAANFDYVFIMSSLNNDLNINRISRYLAVTLQSKAVPVIILTKSDLCDDTEEKVSLLTAAFREVEIIAVSIFNNHGESQLKKYLTPGKTIAFLGSSGVGKSSLLNKLAETELMHVSHIRENDSKGRHTTTHRQLVMLDNGVMIIDTPGMRELGLIDSDEGIGETFKDIIALEKTCKFNNCTHKNEPGCRIQEALKNKELDERQYRNYLQFLEESKTTKLKSLKNKMKK